MVFTFSKWSGLSFKSHWGICNNKGGLWPPLFGYPSTLLLTGCSPAEPASSSGWIVKLLRQNRKITNYFWPHYLISRTCRRVWGWLPRLLNQNWCLWSLIHWSYCKIWYWPVKKNTGRLVQFQHRIPGGRRVYKLILKPHQPLEP